MVSDIYDLADNQLDDFVASAIDRLKHSGLEAVSEDVRVIHPPALLSWTLKIE